MDKIESFMRTYNIFSLITIALTSLEFFIILSFILNKLASLFYVLIYYVLAVVITLVFPQQAFVISYFYPFLFYFSVPLIEQLLTNKENHLTFDWKKYFKQLLRLLIAVATTLSLQAMITVIKAGYFDGQNHVLSLSGYFIYTLEYEIALSVILFTVLLYINREKGDNKLWANGQDHGGSSQTSMTQSQKSLQKNLTKTQKNKLRMLYLKVYLIQLGTFAVVMILPFLTGKVFEFLVMYLSFCIVRYILGFKYSLHYKKESLCAFVGAIVFGILTLAVPFFYVDIICGIALGIGLAILLHLSYKYKSMWLFNSVAKPDKFATLYTFFDGNLDKDYVKMICYYRGLNKFQTELIIDFTRCEKLEYMAKHRNYSTRMLIYKLDEAIDKLIK
jgi:hypothetical protein